MCRKSRRKRSPDDFDSRRLRHRNDTNPRRLRHSGGIDFTSKRMLRTKRARSLMVLIVFVTAAPLVAALLLGWQLLESDRVLEELYIQEQVDLAANSLVVTLQGVIGSSEQRLMIGETNWPA